MGFAGAVTMLSTAAGEDWPQWRGPDRKGVWRETGIVERFNGNTLTAKWRTPIGPGFAGPSVAGGRVFVTDRQKDKDTERVICLDEKNGRILWTHEYPCKYRGVSVDAGPRCTPTVADGKVYAVGSMGHLFCLDVGDGRVIWQKEYVKDFASELPTWGIASAPLVDGPRLIALSGGKEGVLTAMDKDTGRELWRALSAKDFGYSPPVTIEAGEKRQLIIWLPERLVSLEPETGKVNWEQPFHSQDGLSIATPVFDGQRLFVSTFYNGPLMLRMTANRPGAEVLWRGKSNSEIKTDGVHCLMSTPLLKDGYLYGVDSYGALRCLEAGTGRRIWETYQATGNDRWWNAFMVQNGDRVFLANEQGELVIARLSADKYEEISRAKLIDPTNRAQRRDVVWSHPAFANRSVYARNDREILSVFLGQPAGGQ